MLNPTNGATVLDNKNKPKREPMSTNPIMSDQHISDNREMEIDDISAAPDDVINNYTILPNDLIRDETISPQCRWLIIYLLSNKPGWKIKSKQLVAHTKGFMGRDSVRKVMNEAIEAGYMRRESIYRPSNRGSLKGCCYYVSSTPKFKKCLRETEIQCPDLQCPDLQGPVNTAAKELLSQELLSLRINTSLKVPEEPVPAKAGEKRVKKSSNEFSEEVKETAQAMIGAMQVVKPDYQARNGVLLGFQTAVDFMIRLDQRVPQKILDVFRWALADNFWADKMFKPNPAKYLRDKFDQLEMKMNAKPEQVKKDRKFLPSSNDEEAVRIAEEMKARSI